MGVDKHEALRYAGKADMNPSARPVRVKHLGSRYYVTATDGTEVIIDYSKASGRQKKKSLGIPPSNVSRPHGLPRGGRRTGELGIPEPGHDGHKDDH